MIDYIDYWIYGENWMIILIYWIYGENWMIIVIYWLYEENWMIILIDWLIEYIREMTGWVIILIHWIYVEKTEGFSIMRIDLIIKYIDWMYRKQYEKFDKYIMIS